MILTITFLHIWNNTADIVVPMDKDIQKNDNTTQTQHLDDEPIYDTYVDLSSTGEYENCERFKQDISTERAVQGRQTSTTTFLSDERITRRVDNLFGQASLMEDNEAYAITTFKINH